MTDNQNNEGGNTNMNRGKTLQLTRTVESGQVRQSLGHGKSKTVMVEVRKTRTIGRDEAAKQENPAAAAPATTQEIRKPASGLTDSEREKRLRALQEAALEEPKPEIQRFIPKAKQPAKPQASRPAPKMPPLPQVGAEAKKPGDRADKKGDLTGQLVLREREEEAEAPKRGKGRIVGDEPRRRSGKMTVLQALQQEERMRSLASIRRAREKAKRAERAGQLPKEAEKIVREVTVPETIAVQELANRMAVRGIDVVKELMKLGIMATVNQTLDADTAELIVTEFGHKIKRVTEADVETVLEQSKDEEAELKARPPVVTVMGHVDHGKTSLLDAIREANVVAGEAGGITQHIGAYQVTAPSGEKITFIDTPGHEAFTSMRARGAKITDIVILVVAADDGVMPQTIEAINHAKAAEVPIIVAVNKIDKPDANARKVRDQLLAYELVPEELGGEVQYVEVSAKQKLNIDKLLEAVLLQAEVEELKANPTKLASGVVIEARMDKGRGVVASLLVQNGTLKAGDIVLAGVAQGKLRALADDKGQAVKEAQPSFPVEVLGLDVLPSAGDPFYVVENEKQARDIIEFRMKRERDLKAASSTGMSLDQMFKVANALGVKELGIVLKADVQGSAEAIVGSLAKLENEEVRVKIVHSAAGGITESDISLAKATGGIILGFNVRANASAKDLAQKEGIQIRYYSIIYELIDDVKLLLGGLMKPEEKEQFLGTAEVREVFNVTKFGKIAGCMVKSGIIKRNARVRLIRDSVVVHEGKLKSLRRFKDDVSEVKDGFECGIALENYDDIKNGDVIEAFEIIEQQKTL